MKKNFFNTLALALLAVPTMLFTTSCSNEDDTIAGQPTTENSNQGYVMHAVLNASHAVNTTRATYDTSNKTLSFSSGDKLFVSGTDDTAGQFAGTLTWTSGNTFEGDLYMQNSYTGSYDALLSGATKKTATLLPNGYESVAFLSVNNKSTDVLYDDEISQSGYKAFLAGDKATAVAQLSLEQATTYSSGFALSPKNAIIVCTIGGLTANQSYQFKVKGRYSSPYGTVTADASGKAAFCVGETPDNTSYTIEISKGDKTFEDISLGSKDLVKGHVYTVARTATVPATAATGHALSASVIGEVVGTDGLAYAVSDIGNLPTDVSVAGMVTYKNGENGLVIAMADETSSMAWATAVGESGAAAHTPTVTGQTWKLPSQTDFENMFTGCDGSSTKYSELNNKLRAAAGDEAALKSNYSYWTSTGVNDDTAVLVALSGGDATFKNNYSKTISYQVRACFAF